MKIKWTMLSVKAHCCSSFHVWNLNKINTFFKHTSKTALTQHLSVGISFKTNIKHRAACAVCVQQQRCSYLCYATCVKNRRQVRRTEVKGVKGGADRRWHTASVRLWVWFLMATNTHKYISVSSEGVYLMYYYYYYLYFYYYYYQKGIGLFKFNLITFLEDF